jgi:predicted phosphodiesterase
MRYAFVSDLHANLQAWQATRNDISSQDVDAVICLGDIVGYGPRPAETLAAIRETADHFVIGNHDAVVADLFDADLFTDDAQAMIRWTAGRLGQDTVELFRAMPYVIRLECGDITALCTHGGLPEPEEFNYIFTEEEASETWQACEERLVFVGHTHVPQVDVLDSHDQYARHSPVDFSIETDKRYIVNVGSVGMPRTGDTHACYCIYDTDAQFVRWRQVTYDLAALRADVAQRLHNVEGRDRILTTFDFDVTTSAREQLGFTPRKSKITLRRRSRMQPKPFVQAGTVSAHRDQLPAGALSSAVERPTSEQRKKDNRTALIVAGIVAGLLALIMIVGVIYVAVNEPQRPLRRRRRRAAAKPEEPDELTAIRAALKPDSPRPKAPTAGPKPGGQPADGETPRQPRPAPPRPAKASLSDIALGMIKLVDFARNEPDNQIGVYSRIERIMKDAQGTGYEAAVKKLRPAYHRNGAEGLAEAVTAGKALIARGAEWRYLDDGTDPGTEWRGAEYDDAQWPAGAAELGYGDGDETTEIGFGPNKARKFITAYFRHAFDVAQPEHFVNLYFRLVRDDGVILYLNGKEIARSNMPKGDVTHLTVAAKSISGVEEKRCLAAALGTNILAVGRNVLAAEVHQHGPGSSDISFDFELLGIPGEEPAP